MIDSRNVSRRGFLKASAAATAAVCAGSLAATQSSLGAAEEPAAMPYGPFKMGIQSYSLRGYKTSDGKLDFDTALAKTQELGLHVTTNHPKALRDHLEAFRQGVPEYAGLVFRSPPLPGVVFISKPSVELSE